MGAWIETCSRSQQSVCRQVAPLVGAWIETMAACRICSTIAFIKCLAGYLMTPSRSSNSPHRNHQILTVPASSLRKRKLAKVPSVRRTAVGFMARPFLGVELSGRAMRGNRERWSCFHTMLERYSHIPVAPKREAVAGIRLYETGRSDSPEFRGGPCESPCSGEVHHNSVIHN